MYLCFSIHNYFNPLPPHGGRLFSPLSYILYSYFNPLPPHGGRRPFLPDLHILIIFQSTPSAWRETVPRSHPTQSYLHFNPLPPHGGRLISFYFGTQSEKFQSTPSAWRETTLWIHCYRYRIVFQSTPSAWRETVSDKYTHGNDNISIHSLRMEGDCIIIIICSQQFYFNPLPPHGGRLMLSICLGVICYFNPLPPHGGRLYR